MLSLLEDGRFWPLFSSPHWYNGILLAALSRAGGDGSIRLYIIYVMAAIAISGNARCRCYPCLVMTLDRSRLEGQGIASIMTDRAHHAPFSLDFEYNIDVARPAGVNRPRHTELMDVPHVDCADVLAAFQS